MLARSLFSLLLLMALSMDGNSAEQPVSLQVLQEELEALQMKMETHKGTVLVEGKIIDIPIYSNRPGLSLQPVIDHRRLMVFTILKVLNGPLSHEPTRELAIDWPLPNNGPTPFVIEPPGNETKKLQLQYSLTISNGELIYKFTRTKKETPSQ